MNNHYLVDNVHKIGQRYLFEMENLMGLISGKLFDMKNISIPIVACTMEMFAFFK